MKILLGLSGGVTILANQVPAEPQKIETPVTQQSNNSIVKDIFFHPNGIGQRSNIGHRLYTPDQVQNMSKEELIDRERQQQRANAGIEAMKEGANAVSNILPTGEVVGIAPQIAISEGVERIVDANTKAPQTQTRDPKPAESTKPTTEPQASDSDPKTQPEPYYPPRQRDIGAKMNPNYRGNFDDYGPTEKPRFWPEGPQPKPSPTKDPKMKVSIKITVSPDNRVPLDAKQVQLKTNTVVNK
jgi:hypothetical protein